MVLRIAIIIAVAVAAVLAFMVLFAATKPNAFRVQRSVTIHAAPEKIFPLIDDFHNWTGWAPQDKEDHTMKRT